MEIYVFVTRSYLKYVTFFVSVLKALVNSNFHSDSLGRILWTDHWHSLNEVSSVCLESIEQLHCHQYKQTIAVDDSAARRTTPPRAALLIIA